MPDETSAFNIPEAVDSIDAVPEKFRSLYVEKDGKVVFQDPAVLARSLANAKRERDEAKAKAADVSAWKELGARPEEIKALLAERAKSEEDRALKAGEFDKIKAQILEKNETALREKDTVISKKDRVIERYLIEAEATREIAAARGVPPLLLPHVKASTRIVEEGDEYATRVVDASGSPRVNSKGEYLTIKDLVAEMRSSEIFGRAFEATGAGGSGAPSSGNRASGARTMPLAEFNAKPAKERARLMATQGFSLSD